MFRNKNDSSAGNTPAVLLIKMTLFLGCVVSGGVVSAAPAAETSSEPAVKQAAATARVPVDVKADIEAILKGNSKCLKCHSREKFKALENGKEMSLLVHEDEFAASVHGEISCVSCHESIGDKKHPSSSTNITINSKREYSVAMNVSCRNCHEKKYELYEHSVHAAMITQGSQKAPLCADCHSAHAVKSMEHYPLESGLPCRNCHERIFLAYADSVHGQARINGNVIRDSHIHAPICGDCHRSHEVTALAIGDILRTTCIGCHENVILLHNQWLPNAGTHLDIVSCAVCHAPFAKRRIDLHLYDNVSQVPVGQKEGDESLQQQIQAIEEAGGSVDLLKVWSSTGQQDQTADVSLRGRMEVMSGVAAHQIADKSFAVRTCDSCHQTDTRQRQNVTVSVTQPDGRTQSFEADREILSAVTTVNTISDFYALGGNPNKLLDYLLLLSLLAGFAIPIGHFTMGKIISEKKERGEQ